MKNSIILLTLSVAFLFAGEIFAQNATYTYLDSPIKINGSCPFTMAISSYEFSGMGPGDACFLVEVDSNSPDDVFIMSDSGYYTEYEAGTVSGVIICFGPTFYGTEWRDGVISCGLIGPRGDELCIDGCTVTIGPL